MQVENNVLYDQSVYLNTTQSLNKIATGKELNSAADNAASLAISEELIAQTSGISQAIDNTNSAIATMQIGDQAFNEQSKILDQVKEKLLQASTSTTSQEGRESLLNDIQGLMDNLNNIASSTNYNGQTLLQNGINDSSATTGLQFQSGEDSSSLIETDSIQSNTTGLGLDSLVSQDASTFTIDAARSFLDQVDNALNTLNDYRSNFGSSQVQLESNGRSLLSDYTQTSNSSSILTDVDYSKEVANFSKQNILAQIGAYAAAQSNNINQSIVTRALS
ncbi:flagellin [Halarcobacter ebronensis]|uniref:Flagellin n=1 Tax=Halarcobacter ebronensis TaxID=1462615 RepID=A0A4Q1AZS1_9BACT|nr:flagellin [Halarcobacter ebronensis]QKF82228.1 putative flagellar protein [Halarcobacter ebronensis]RXK07738.1 flagellin [Halarcobacter ebronensis]